MPDVISQSRYLNKLRWILEGKERDKEREELMERDRGRGGSFKKMILQPHHNGERERKVEMVFGWMDI